MIARPVINADEYVDRTVALVRHPSGAVGVYDQRSHTFLGIVDPRDYEPSDRIVVHGDNEFGFFQGLLLVLTVLVIAGVVGVVCINIGRHLGGG